MRSEAKWLQEHVDALAKRGVKLDADRIGPREELDVEANYWLGVLEGAAGMTDMTIVELLDALCIDGTAIAAET